VKLHDLRPAAGSKRKRIRAGRGIAAGRGKTAGYGTKGQTARSGGSIPAWFEGGQTPIHIRIPKLRGFRNVLRAEVAVVNVGRIQQWIDAGRLKGESPLSVNADILAAAGLLKTRGKPLKVLGTGEISARILFAADAFTQSAAAKIKAAGGDIAVYESATPASAAPVGTKAGKNPPTPGKRAPAKRTRPAEEASGEDA